MVSLSDLPLVNTDDSIDWAIKMMELGYKSPSLFMLASFSKPANYFEILKYINNSVQELGFQFKVGTDAIVSYAAYYIHQIAKGDDVRKDLIKVHEFCLLCDMNESIFDFCLLHWAWDDIEHDMPYTHYWDNADKSNIRSIVIEEAENWILDNYGKYRQ
jgi:hypothetical protein